MPADIGRCTSSTEIWIHTFLHIPDLLKQPPWDISSCVVDEQMLFHPSNAVNIHIVVPCMVYGVPGQVLPGL